MRNTLILVYTAVYRNRAHEITIMDDLKELSKVLKRQLKRLLDRWRDSVVCAGLDAAAAISSRCMLLIVQTSRENVLKRLRRQIFYLMLHGHLLDAVFCNLCIFSGCVCMANRNYTHRRCI